jgi:hypothetical protein
MLQLFQNSEQVAPPGMVGRFPMRNPKGGQYVLRAGVRLQITPHLPHVIVLQ